LRKASPLLNGAALLAALLPAWPVDQAVDLKRKSHKKRVSRSWLPISPLQEIIIRMGTDVPIRQDQAAALLF
jgi:hypothetical protein